MNIGGSEARKVEENNDMERLPGPTAAGAGSRVLLVRGQAERELIQATEALERKTEELDNSLVARREHRETCMFLSSTIMRIRAAFSHGCFPNAAMKSLPLIVQRAH
jgi:hypothetical protein